MQPIQSIICFNGGSAGDIVKVLCHQSMIDSLFLREDGTALPPQYFKDMCENIVIKKNTYQEIDFTKTTIVENSHFYLDFFPLIAKNIFYIDYRKEFNSVIVDEYIRKRHNNDLDSFIADQKITMNPAIASKITRANCRDVAIILNNKNLQSWRNNKLMQSIVFDDLFEINKIKTVIETITGTKITNSDKFEMLYTTWIKNNPTLYNFFI